MNGEEWSGVRKRLYKADCRNGLVAEKGRFQVHQADIYNDVSLYQKKKELKLQSIWLSSSYDCAQAVILL